MPASSPANGGNADIKGTAPSIDALVDPDTAWVEVNDAQLDALEDPDAEWVEVNDAQLDALEDPDAALPEDLVALDDVGPVAPDAERDGAVSLPNDSLGFTVEHIVARYRDDLEFSPTIFLSGEQTSEGLDRLTAFVVARMKDGSSGIPSLWHSGEIHTSGTRFSTYMTKTWSFTFSPLTGGGRVLEPASAIEQYELFFTEADLFYRRRATDLSHAYDVRLERATPDLCYLPPLAASVLTCPIGARCEPDARLDDLLGACVDDDGDAPSLTHMEFLGIGEEGECGYQSAFPARYRLAGSSSGKIVAFVKAISPKLIREIKYIKNDTLLGEFEVELSLICGDYFWLKQQLDDQRVEISAIDEFGRVSNTIEVVHSRVLPDLDVPFEWSCYYLNYGTGDGCHCGCGVRDPDCLTDSIDECADPNDEFFTTQACFIDLETYQEVLDPENLAACLPPVCGNGILEQGEECDSFEDAPDLCSDDCRVDPSWSCSDSALYNGICDCGCRLFDPECSSREISDCEVCHQCACGRINPNDTKRCLPSECGNGLIDVLDECEPPGAFACTQDCQISDSWTCQESSYDDGICDCGCGLNDIDCHDGWGFDECERCALCPGYRCVSLSPNDPTQCSPPGCGNQVIEQGEECDPPDGAGCLEGCVINEAWTCSSYDYDDGICDCGCGLPDPDCAWAENARGCHQCPGCGENRCELIDPDDLTRCLPSVCGNEIVEAGETCDPPREGACSNTCVLSELWTCDPRNYDYGAGCDCGCGLVDPDCGEAPIAARCDRCQGCIDERCDLVDAEDLTRCAPPECGNGIIEEGEGCDPPDGFGCSEDCRFDAWTCDLDFYGDGFMCNCGCGAMDIDCGPAPTLDDCAEICIELTCCWEPNPERLEECLDP